MLIIIIANSIIVDQPIVYEKVELEYQISCPSSEHSCIQSIQPEPQSRQTEARQTQPSLLSAHLKYGNKINNSITMIRIECKLCTIIIIR